MHENSRAFSFVNRITSVQAGLRITGQYDIPADLDSFPSSLVAESVGQLAAWSAMAALNFERRPVAGLAATIELLAPVRPGQALELAAELESVDAEAVAYGGTAHADGKPVLRLHHCVGPMLSQEEFDDPQAVRRRFELLCDSGAAPGGFGGVPSLVLEPAGGATGEWRRATLRVPQSAPFFDDHFPRRAVFPGTLLMHSNLQLAAALAAELPQQPPGSADKIMLQNPAVPLVWTLRTVSDVKIRAFIPPGEILECEAKVHERSGNTAILAVESRKGKRLVGGARVLLSAGEGL